MGKIRYLYIIISLLFVVFFTYGQVIEFYEFDFPPYRIIEGDFKGKGVLGYLKDNFIKEFSDYQVNTHVSNNKRVLSEMKKKPNILFSTGLKTIEREEIGIFSIPYLMLLPNGIIIDKDSYHRFLPYLNDIGEVQFERLLTDSFLKGGIYLERAYGGIIDEYLKKHKNSPNLVLDYYDSFGRNFLKVKNGTLDYVIGYPVEAGYFMKGEEVLSENIISLPVEGMPEYLLAYVIFSKGDFGEKVIKEIDIFLEDIIRQKEFHEKYEFWLDEETIKRYRTYIKDVFDYSY